MMEEIISIREKSTELSVRTISKRDWDILIKVLQRPVKRSVDVFEGIQRLKENNSISEETFVRLLEKFEDLNDDVFQNFVMELVVVLSVEDFIFLLRDMKCVDIADEIMNAKFGMNIEVLVGKRIGVSERILTYYSRTKSDMDNNVFKDRKLELENRAKELVASFSGIHDLERKSFAVHKYVVITFLRTTQFRDKSSRDRILNEMKANIPIEVDTTFADIIYNGNMAKTAIFNGDEELAKKYIHDALVLGDNCQESFVKIFTYHDQQYVYRCIFSNDPNEENLKNVSVSGQLGQAILQDHSDEKALIWRKGFVSETTMSILKIHRTFEVMYQESISDSERKMADQLLKALQIQTSTEEKRREMLIYLCKARIHEKDNIRLAMSYAKKAHNYAKDCSHFPADLVNISNYYYQLSGQTIPKQIETLAN